MNEHLTALKKRRKKERAHAIANNLVDDPNRQRRLQDAITFTGTCPDMCPAFERVERIVQKAVDGCEKTVAPDGQEVPSEELMVKRFRRSAAGDDAQLPSDVRAPPILKKTLDYLINDVVGGPKPLSRTHAFLWDRTRSIRNDFTIQNVQGSKNADLLLAIDCYERIARFHVHALHDFARPDVDDSGFTAHNEREQLNKTLLSLMEFYDLSAFRSLKCPNEAEFRAYNIVMHFHDQDIEREAMNLGRERPELYNHPRIQRALELYAAVTNTHDLHGPLRPSASNPIAQNNVAKFFRLVRSSQISYTMACVAEIHFNHIRKNALTALRAGFRSPATMQDCSLRHLKDMLGFDNEVQVRAFCEACGMDVADGGIGKEAYLVLTSGPQQLVDPGGILRQPFSETVVEHKRHGRTLPHVINGLTPKKLPESVVQWYFCSEGGLMDDFIDFGLPQMVQDAYDEYEKEQAASFRRRKVSERFFYRWKYTAQRKGLVARGRQSRHRMSLLISQQRKRKNGSDSSSLVEQVTRRAMQPPPTEPGRRHKRAKTVPDATSMMRPPPPAQAKSTPVGERRSRRSSSNTSSSMSSLSSSHLQGASVFSPSVLADARAIINQSGGGDTIQSDYWRLKAAGLKTLPNGVTEPTTMPRSSSAARKRALEADDDPEDAETEAEAKSPPKRLASSSRVNGHHRVPQKQDEDEALFAELAALRAAMDEGIEFYRGWGEGTWS
ncbi:MAG: hypothetical protein M1832_005775 [Thelocarpon impressellum]|nr:MAG: hypothetical protein M1832_005775 [Thelocarpon impressellum]